MKHNFTIDAELSIHPVEGFDNFTQNSVGTKYFAAKLDGWAPAQGEHLFVAFERKDGGNKLDPIFMGVKEEVYYTVMPREVMFDNGEWQACIYKKLNFNENTGKADAQETGENFDFLVKRTIRDDSGNAVTQYDVVNLHSSAIEAARRAEEAEKHVEGTASDSYDAARRAETAAQAAEQSKKNAEESAQASEESAEKAEQSAQAAERSAEAADEKALLSAQNEQKAAESAEEAATQALAAKQSAERAETSVVYAGNAQTAAEEARDKAQDFAKIAEAVTSSGLRKVIVHSLPEEGSDNLIYLVPSEAATEDNYYDEYLWVADEETGKAKFEKIGTTRTDLTPYVKKTLLEETKEAIMAELANEVTEREDHDSTLRTSITAEVAAREGADEEISATLSEEIATRVSADEDIENAIALETTARIEADSALREAVANVQAYDLTIRTQEEFEAWYATLDAGTCEAHSVLLVGDGGTLKFTRSDGYGLKLPETLYQLDGINNAIIEITNKEYNETTNLAAIWYNSQPTDTLHSISNLYVSCKAIAGAASVGFYNCIQLTNCSVVVLGTGTTVGVHQLKAFSTCKNLTNCYGEAKNAGYGGDVAGFYKCTNLLNCSINTDKTNIGNVTVYGFQSCAYLCNCISNAQSPGRIAYGFYSCSQLSNCYGIGEGYNGYSFYNCYRVTNCVATYSGSQSAGFYNCSYCSSCMRSSGTVSKIWDGTITKRDDQSCELNS